MYSSLAVLSWFTWDFRFLSSLVVILVIVPGVISITGPLLCVGNQRLRLEALVEIDTAFVLDRLWKNDFWKRGRSVGMLPTMITRFT